MRPRSPARLPSFTVALGLALTASAACDGGGAGWFPVITTAITVDCMPAAGTPERRDWDADVRAFQERHADITIVGEQTPCGGPLTSTERPASPRTADVFYATFAEAPEIVAAGQAAELTPYVSGGGGAFAKIRTNRFTADPDRVFGVPWRVSPVALLYNRKLFDQAGLNPDGPPATWAALREAAKKIADSKEEILGYAPYAEGNDGGLNFAAHIAGAGYGIVTQEDQEDRTASPGASPGATPVAQRTQKAAFNTATAHDRLQLLRDMRWEDDSLGDEQPLRRADALQMMAEGRLGMYLSTPDDLIALVDAYGAEAGEFALAPIPEASASLVAGDGFMINARTTAAKVRAALLWLEFHNLTPGRGALDYGRAGSQGRAVGPPTADFLEPETAAKERRLRTGHATLPAANFSRFEDAVGSLPSITGPPHASAVDSILGDMLSTALTDKTADVQALLDEAERKVNDTLTQPP